MAYSLATHYAGQALLDGFSFFTGKDPSNGFVNYQSQAAATAQGLVTIDEFNRVRLGVDTYNNYTVSDVGRPSVRLTSYQGFTHGLFIADFAHMPASTCGVWPACCNYASPVSDATSYGDSFNAQGGGVYALEWDSDGLKVWHFPRSAIPSDIAFAPLTSPEPASWGPPQALFGGSGCNADSFFFNMSLVININLCGDYAGNVWGKTDKCNTLAPTCKDYVASSPEAFLGAFWNVNYIDVYQKPSSPKASGTPNATASAASPPYATSVSTRLPSANTTTALPQPSNTRTITLTTATASSVPTKSGGGLSDPATINGYTLLGCFGSSSGYLTWSSAAEYATMDNEACVASCAGRKYSGVFATTCYCADTLGDTSAVENAQCDRACPGNPNESCGGLVKGTKMPPSNSTMPTSNSTVAGLRPLSRRAAPANILLTVYGNLAAAPPPPGAPAMGGSSSGAGGNSTATGGNGGNGGGVGSNVTITTAVTMTYTTVCATNPAHLVAVAYCTILTITTCSGTKAPVPTASGAAVVTGGLGPFWNGTTNGTAPAAAPAAALVPMTTYAETCSACGPRGANTVTLTVPLAVATAAKADVVVTAIAVATVVPVKLGSSNSSRPFSHDTNGTAGGVPPTTQLAVINGASSAFADDFVGVIGMMLSLALLGAVFLL
ncbi:uncharacterized protein PG986_005977 [Apiospora aurea]|uniref:WSC domain-containing protein n=1 Tax=Apiospora aurea TaxID=335848 RepID=A0ABR1QJB2_9PEZI